MNSKTNPSFGGWVFAGLGIPRRSTSCGALSSRTVIRTTQSRKHINTNNYLSLSNNNSSGRKEHFCKNFGGVSGINLEGGRGFAHSCKWFESGSQNSTNLFLGDESQYTGRCYSRCVRSMKSATRESLFDPKDVIIVHHNCQCSTGLCLLL